MSPLSVASLTLVVALGTTGGSAGGGGGGGGGGTPTLPAAATSLATLKAGLDAIAADPLLNEPGVVALTVDAMWLRGPDVGMSGGKAVTWDEGLHGLAKDRFVLDPAIAGNTGATVDGDGNICSPGLYIPTGSGHGTQTPGERLSWGVLGSAQFNGSGLAMLLSVGRPSASGAALGADSGAAICAIKRQLMVTTPGRFGIGLSGPIVNDKMRLAWFSVSPKSHYVHQGVGRDGVLMPAVYDTLDTGTSSYQDYIYGTMFPEGGGDRPIVLHAPGDPAGLTTWFDSTEPVSFIIKGRGTLTRWQSKYLHDFLETYAGEYRATEPTGVQWGDSIYNQRANNGQNLDDAVPVGAPYAGLTILNGGVTGIGWKQMRDLFGDREARNDYSARTRVALTSGEFINQPLAAADYASCVAWLLRYPTLGANVRFAPWMPRSQHMQGSAPAGSAYPTIGAHYRADMIARAQAGGVTAVISMADNEDMGDAAVAAWETAHGAGTFDPAKNNDHTHPNATGYLYCQYDVDHADADSYDAVAGTGGRCFGRDRGVMKFLLDAA